MSTESKPTPVRINARQFFSRAMPVTPMRVLCQTINARIANHVDIAPASRPTGLPSLPLLNGLSAVEIKSAKSSGVKVLPVRWISVWRQAVSILRASGFSPSFCGTSCGAAERAGLPVRPIVCLSLSVCAQEIYFREPVCSWVGAPPRKFHENAFFSFPTFLTASAPDSPPFAFRNSL
jgi:hypothetical protein